MRAIPYLRPFVHIGHVVRTMTVALVTAVLIFGLVTTGTAQPTSERTDGTTTDTATSSGFSTAQGQGTAHITQNEFEVLQFNLCNSGRADCYDDDPGTAIPQAVDYIRFLAPNVVTLNEICEDDIDPLFSAFIDGWEFYSDVPFYGFWVFKPVEVMGGGSPIRCENDERFGIAVMGYVPSSQWSGLQARGEAYHEDIQDPIGGEWRVWACGYPTGNYIVCTTHLSADSLQYAFWQCIDLTTSLTNGALHEEFGEHPTTIGGDFNLQYVPGHPYDVQTCVPNDWFRKGDGSVQHVMADSHFTPNGDQILLDMGESTDHDALLVPMTETP